VIVLSWNTRELLQRCLASLFQHGPGPDPGMRLEVIVVDNASHDGSADLVAREFPQARLVRNQRNEGYARGNNQGLALARAPLVLLLNSDTEVRPGALALLVEFLRACPEYGAAAPRPLHPAGRVPRPCMR